MKLKILIENDVFWEDENDSRNTNKVASEYFDVIEVNSVLEITENLNEPLVMYRGSFSVGSCLYRTYKHLFFAIGLSPMDFSLLLLYPHPYFGGK